MAWPPTLEDLRADMRIPEEDTRDDEALTDVLDAAVSFVETVYDVTAENEDEAAEAAAFLATDRARRGTLMYARRLYSRRNTPDGLVQAGDFGAFRISTFDRDCDRLLKLGPFRKGILA